MNEDLISGIYFKSKRKAYLMRLWTTFLIPLSLTLLFPLCYWYQSKYIIERKKIDGKECYFTGKLWVMYLLYLFFLGSFIGLLFLFDFIFHKSGVSFFMNTPQVIITTLFGAIVHFLLVTVQDRYIQMCTHFKDEPKARSGFHMNVLLMILKIVVVKLINMVSLGLLQPIAQTMTYNYIYKRGYYDHIDLDYHFSLKKLYPRWFLDLFLAIITLGFYIPAVLNRLDRKCMTHAHIRKTEETKKVGE